MIEFRSDGCDLAEVWIEGKLVLSLNSDDHDLESCFKTLEAVAKALKIKMSWDNTYSWDGASELLTKDL